VNRHCHLPEFNKDDMDFKQLVSAIRGPHIEFLCHPEDKGIIPEPVPANKVMPKWFRELPGKLPGAALQSSTVKRCMPFLDALSLGYIIPLAADVEFKTNENASGVNYRSMFHRPMVENHSAEQIAGEKNPAHPKPPMKFLNHWAIKVPKGYSVLFLPPINRHEPRFTCMSGFVDCDNYFEFINFPFVFHQPNFVGLIEAGTPLVQAIPIRRDTVLDKMFTGKLAQPDYKLLEHTRGLRRVHESHYRDNVRMKMR
jgi:hypothetical protein